MALEHRAGRSYYYRHVRDGEKVRKEYVGTGLVAELAAEADRIERERDTVKKGRSGRKFERLKALMVPVLELNHAAGVLVRAELIVGGYHRRKGEWRRKHEST